MPGLGRHTREPVRAQSFANCVGVCVAVCCEQRTSRPRHCNRSLVEHNALYQPGSRLAERCSLERIDINTVALAFAWQRFVARKIDNGVERIALLGDRRPRHQARIPVFEKNRRYPPILETCTRLQPNFLAVARSH